MDRGTKVDEKSRSSHLSLNASDSELETTYDSSFGQPLVVVEKFDDLKHRKDSNTPTVKEKSSYRWYHINREMLLSKIAYFLEGGRRMSYTPFLILFFTSIGLSKVEAGIILGFR